MGENASDKLDAINDALLGTFDKPGLITVVHQTNDTVVMLKADVKDYMARMDARMDELKGDVENLKTTKVKAIGIMIGASIASGGAGAAVAKALMGGH